MCWHCLVRDISFPNKDVYNNVNNVFTAFTKGQMLSLAGGWILKEKYVFGKYYPMQYKLYV